MRKSIVTLLLMALFIPVFGQNMTKASDSDPEATRILEALRNKYEGFTSLALDFDLVIRQPEVPEEVQNGKLLRQQEQYKVDLGQQTLLSNGKELYVILHGNKEVQINDLPDEEDMTILSPQSLFSFYEGGNFVYALVNVVSQGTRIVQQIEFKPLDDMSEYFKIRLEIDKKKKEPIQVIAFGRDGANYVLRFKSLKPGGTLPASTFEFRKADYSDYYIEDLRQ